MRDLVGRVYALYFFLRSGGRVRGRSFILRKPSLVRVRRGASLTIGQGVMIEKGARIVVHASLDIGPRTYIGKNATIVAFDHVQIGARTLLGENVSIHSEDHGPAGRRDNFTTAPVTIAEDVWVCAGVVVTKGSTVGAGSTIAANAVVNSEIPANTLAGGLPARVIRLLSEQSAR